MTFDHNNKVVQLCVQGMDMEGQGQPKKAIELFLQAWSESASDFEKFVAAHYVARHQKTVSDKLKWDQRALQLALKINDNPIDDALPSLYLNIAKCYEDLGDLSMAKANYELALANMHSLSDDGYRRMIESGVTCGLIRVST